MVIMSNEFLRINVLNVPFINTTQAAFLTAVESRINHRQNTFIVTANPEIVMYARDDPSYQRILKNADYITPDGIGILKGAAILGTQMEERITGYDYARILKWGNQRHKSVYLVGAKPEVITDVRRSLQHATLIWLWRAPTTVISDFDPSLMTLLKLSQTWYF